jgi:broad specificity polyphosphatase/5'/3'-nucleotidase SurE
MVDHWRPLHGRLNWMKRVSFVSVNVPQIQSTFKRRLVYCRVERRQQQGDKHQEADSSMQIARFH